MIASDIMTRDVITVDEKATLADALLVMSERDVRHVPVVRKGRELLGIISDRDLRRFNTSLVQDMESFDRLQARLHAKVGTVMSTDLVTVEPETDVAELIDLMIDEKLGALPVVDAETSQLVGIVSYIDVLRAARDTLD